MLMFRLDPFAVLLNSIPVLSQIGQQADIKCTTNRLTLMLSHSAPPFIAAIQMSPEFFNLYDSDHTYHFRFSLDRFYVIMYQMELQDPEPKVMLRQLDLVPYEVELEGHNDYSIFVSIDAQDFKRVVSELSARSVSVNLSDSQVKFSIENKEMIFTKEERRCIIGGLRKREEYHFVITLHPLVFFLDLSHQGKRMWLFMQMDSSSMLILPFGMWTQFWVYFPSH
ncbi:unnamed protein product [Citrullus colocynthis]|uniref:Proliferating cell nuclear antigen n=1 Tax=Citrullus colocynthis TaxID=252529 RepID=A0ABP0ZDC2_9ROSI